MSRGPMLGAFTIFVWGFVVTQFRTPSFQFAWAFGVMGVLLALAVGRQSLVVRGVHGVDSRRVGRMAVAVLLSAALAVLAILVGLVVERAVAVPGTPWSDSFLRALWHGFAVFTLGVVVSR